MGDEGKERIYRDAYEALMGSKWVGTLKRLYEFVDSIEFGRGSSYEEVP